MFVTPSEASCAFKVMPVIVNKDIENIILLKYFK